MNRIVFVWLMPTVVFLSLIYCLRFIGIEREVFDFVGRLATAVIIVVLNGYVIEWIRLDKEDL